MVLGWTQASAFVCGGTRILRCLRDPVVNAEAFGLGRANAETFAPTARYRWILNRRSALAVADPPIGRANAESWPENAETKKRASPTGLKPDPETRNRGRARCRSRPSRRPPPAPAEAAHQQVTTPCGSAPPRSRPPAAARQQGHDPRRQRTSPQRGRDPTPTTSASPGSPQRRRGRG
ncbi:hypothetical protein AERYTH_00030 [Aeromicrobium erythreum]|uniref:Uncharacterized protein n=1 Tax=Aeromicrobium erythreum TaxID=2041 RepID=A0A0U4BWB2_9ACTN|nr:hypothetical protein AERYTH_00030 [Aeromicrobium erythreum]